MAVAEQGLQIGLAGEDVEITGRGEVNQGAFFGGDQVEDVVERALALAVPQHQAAFRRAPSPGLWRVIDEAFAFGWRVKFRVGQAPILLRQFSMRRPARTGLGTG